MLCCTLSYLRLKLGRNLCVGASFPAKVVVRSSISSTPLTSAFADAMEDDGTAEGQEDLVAWLACPRYEKSHDTLMKTLHEPVTVCKNFDGVKFSRV